ncbi:MAG: hypothetical protein KC635_17105 [Myxococcales bacterium]|nr:hypothetical protein [Myxococcales bacterium]MCB9735038.1 hypothetical protein [Deltaproteobacteria bacterium]
MITPLLHALLVAMGVARVLIGIAPLLAPSFSSRLLAFPTAHDNATARLMGRLFGVRDVGLGLLVFYALGHVELLPAMCVFQAMMDGGDLLSIMVPLVRRQGIDRAAWLSAGFALVGGASWLVVLAAM